MTMIDVLFPVLGSRLPTDHNYALYSALAHLLPCIHDGSMKFGMAPITGPHIGQGTLHLDVKQSRMRLRVDRSDIRRVLPLAGKPLDVMGQRIRLGVPHIEVLQPASALIARIVAIKNAKDEQMFREAARKQLDQIGIEGKLRLPERVGKDGRIEPMRRVLRIKQTRIVCYSLLVERLKLEESIRLQEIGLGGRRHLGGGVFLPARVQENSHDKAVAGQEPEARGSLA